MRKRPALEHKVAHRVRFGVHFQSPNMTVTPLGKEVGTIEPRKLAATIEMPSNDADAFTSEASVGMHGVDGVRASKKWLRMKGGAHRPFAMTPAIVGTGFDEINLWEKSSGFALVMTRGIASKRPQPQRPAAAKA